ncbi:MAG: DUF1768 domain-containing protein [Bacteroidales bacterium]|nr:DUF1768 domain-containing protein [Bacteroidales bacterium]
MIDKFRGNYGFLSNMHSAPVTYDGLTYKCSEAAYQAQKSKDIEIRKRFTAMDGVNAKKYSKEIEIREDWSNVELKIMYDICYIKFTQNPDLKEKLLATGEEPLVEGNEWHDTFWGVCNGKGTNYLGKILMRVRKDIRNATAQPKNVGITEAGDAGLDFSWLDKLYDINIIISKHLTIENKELINALLKNSHKIIFHCTVTGYGGTKMEPNVPTPFEVYDGLSTLIKKGFPVDQIVLRTDPIIPTIKGIKRAEKVWDMFSDLGITRCRYSVLDMYPHVKERIVSVYGSTPYDSFTAPVNMLEWVKNSVYDYMNIYNFESCAENNLSEAIGCISEKDFKILGLPFNNTTGGYQRKGCLCVAGKTELLNNKKRCPSGCLYCYWKD